MLFATLPTQSGPLSRFGGAGSGGAAFGDGDRSAADDGRSSFGRVIACMAAVLFIKLLLVSQVAQLQRRKNQELD